MWGISFDELAKKAQEAKVQASEGFSQITTPNAASIFNLDSMMSSTDKDDPNDTTDTVSNDTTTNNNNNHNHHNHTSTTSSTTTTTSKQTVPSSPFDTAAAAWSSNTTAVAQNLFGGSIVSSQPSDSLLVEDEEDEEAEAEEADETKESQRADNSTHVVVTNEEPMVVQSTSVGEEEGDYTNSTMESTKNLHLLDNGLQSGTIVNGGRKDDERVTITTTHHNNGGGGGGGDVGSEPTVPNPTIQVKNETIEMDHPILPEQPPVLCHSNSNETNHNEETWDFDDELADSKEEEEEKNGTPRTNNHKPLEMEGSSSSSSSSSTAMQSTTIPVNAISLSHNESITEVEKEITKQPKEEEEEVVDGTNDEPVVTNDELVTEQTKEEEEEEEEEGNNDNEEDNNGRDDRVKTIDEVQRENASTPQLEHELDISLRGDIDLTLLSKTTKNNHTTQAEKTVTSSEHEHELDVSLRGGIDLTLFSKQKKHNTTQAEAVGGGGVGGGGGGGETVTSSEHENKLDVSLRGGIVLPPPVRVSAGTTDGVTTEAATTATTTADASDAEEGGEGDDDELNKGEKAGMNDRGEGTEPPHPLDTDLDVSVRGGIDLSSYPKTFRSATTATDDDAIATTTTPAAIGVGDEEQEEGRLLTPRDGEEIRNLVNDLSFELDGVIAEVTELAQVGRDDDRSNSSNNNNNEDDDGGDGDVVALSMDGGEGTELDTNDESESKGEGKEEKEEDLVDPTAENQQPKTYSEEEQMTTEADNEEGDDPSPSSQPTNVVEEEEDFLSEEVQRSDDVEDATPQTSLGEKFVGDGVMTGGGVGISDDGEEGDGGAVSVVESFDTQNDDDDDIQEEEEEEEEGDALQEEEMCYQPPDDLDQEVPVRYGDRVSSSSACHDANDRDKKEDDDGGVDFPSTPRSIHGSYTDDDDDDGDCLDEMYEDSEYDDESVLVEDSEETPSFDATVSNANVDASADSSSALFPNELQTTSSHPEPPPPSSPSPSASASPSPTPPPSTTTNNPPPPIPQYALEKFMNQLSRLNSEHETEMLHVRRTHETELDILRTELESARSALTEAKSSYGGGGNTSNAIGLQDKFLVQVRKLEKEFNIQLKEKEEERKALVEERERLEVEVAEGKVRLGGLEREMMEKNQRLATIDEKEAKIKNLELTLTDVRSDLASSQEAFTTLKTRVKTVATELKDRRAECRTLHATEADLNLRLSTLTSTHEDAVLKLSRSTKMNDAKSQRISSLEEELSSLRTELEKATATAMERGRVGDAALGTYKKKAQAGLAAANARAANANAAREEAEIDAAAARGEAEEAKKVARSAEEEKKGLERRWREEVDSLKKNNDSLDEMLEETKKELEAVRVECKRLVGKVEEGRRAKETMFEELGKKDECMGKEQEKRAAMEQEIAISRIKAKGLEEELALVKEELERSTSAAFLARQKQNEGTAPHPSTNAIAVANGVGMANAKPNGAAESDGNVVMLREELAVANEAIRDLKGVLGKIIAQNPSMLEQVQMLGGLKFDDPTLEGITKEIHTETTGADAGAGAGTAYTSHNDTTPLFFAIEKQAELKTLREEISRLAALLSDAEAGRTESYEAMEDMRLRMEDAESRLRRFKKLGAASGARQLRQADTDGAYGGWRNNLAMRTRTSGLAKAPGDEDGITPHGDSTVNLEYLKNVMLSYLNAKTLNEKRALVPVIAAVLELTADEQTLVMENVEKSAGIDGVGTSLFENIQNKGVSGLFG